MPPINIVYGEQAFIVIDKYIQPGFSIVIMIDDIILIEGKNDDLCNE